MRRSLCYMSIRVSLRILGRPSVRQGEYPPELRIARARQKRKGEVHMIAGRIEVLGAEQ
jgi:hypothetical protein